MLIMTEHSAVSISAKTGIKMPPEKDQISQREKKPVTGYDKYINWKIFIVPVVLFFAILFLPTLDTIKDVGTEYQLGPKAVKSHIVSALFHVDLDNAEQWQLLAANIMEQNMRMGALTRDRFLKRDVKWCKKYKIVVEDVNFQRAQTYIKENVTDEAFLSLMKSSYDLRTKGLNYETLSDKDKTNADKGAWGIKVSIAMATFVVICFLTECIPLPGVAFCVGLILIFTGVIPYEDVAGLYWSDSVWFIMGSLMFAAAFVKTGVDKRVCLMMFNKLAVPNVRWISLVFFIVIAPVAAFVSDHALAAMFLPIGMLLYENSLTKEIPEDPQLGKLLMMTIVMACNIGGPGAPSGGARNVIMVGYLRDMFGYDIGFFQWVTYCFPFLILMIPLAWLLTNWLFKPRIHSLAPAMDHLRNEIAKMGKWNGKQIWALIIFVVMLILWFTEKDLYESGIIPIRLGVGVVAVAGAIAYLIVGVVNWRDYQQKVDWGVVWLYAGAIIFGRTLDSTGAAYWLARSVTETLAPLGMNSGLPLMAISNGLTAVVTNLMADGPAAAAVGPVTLNIAALVHPGSTFLPFMAMSTGISASFAYCMIIGTPPNAIIYSSGYVTAKDFLRIGIPLWFLAQIILLALTAFYWQFRGFGGLPGF
jgi:solute carrier family 13 (sodium-dependent dicarboxylate transporter), member 2/3/5